VSAKITSSITGLFCEDIREEKSGQETFVGVMSDNLNISSPHGVMPKLCIYVRARFPIGSPPPPSVKLRLELPWGEALDMGTADQALIEKGIREAEEIGSASFGLNMKAQIIGFRIEGPGRIIIVAEIGNKTLEAGALHIKVLVPEVVTEAPEKAEAGEDTRTVSRRPPRRIRIPKGT
jgi:hypothetical protein